MATDRYILRVSCSRETLDRLNQRAGREGRTLSAMARRLLEGALGVDESIPATAKALATQAPGGRTSTPAEQWRALTSGPQLPDTERREREATREERMAIAQQALRDAEAKVGADAESVAGGEPTLVPVE